LSVLQYCRYSSCKRRFARTTSPNTVLQEHSLNPFRINQGSLIERLHSCLRPHLSPSTHCPLISCALNGARSALRYARCILHIRDRSITQIPPLAVSRRICGSSVSPPSKSRPLLLNASQRNGGPVVAGADCGSGGVHATATGHPAAERSHCSRRSTRRRSVQRTQRRFCQSRDGD